jgi:cellulose synthase/poly-beta-1,6-N-acetylglucosamine synthase-like glycosyltransferase
LGKVIYDLFVEGVVTLFVLVWFSFALIMWHRRFIAKKAEKIELYEAPRRRMRVEYDENAFEVTTLVTCAKEDPVVFEQAMSMLRQQAGLARHSIIVMMDAFDNPSPDDLRCLEIARSYADVVFMTNVCDKRENLKNLFAIARSKNLLHELVAPMDSDTVCDHQWVMAYLCDAFLDSSVGGATTAQRCLKVDTYPERIGDWLENARLKSSMAAGSYYGQVGCLPGRLYMARTHLLEERIKELPEEVWTGIRLKMSYPFCERWYAKCKAGDDRQITNYILQAGFDTVLVFAAGVKTLVPDNWDKLWKTWRRWGTSSQGYVYRTLDWLWRKPFVLWHYTTDIYISHASVALVLVWFYSLFFSSADLLLPLSIVLAMSIVGVLLTFTIRQWPHLKEHPYDFFLLPLFVLVVTYAQFIRVQAHWTPWRIGVWGTRAGVDDEVKETFVTEVTAHT